MCENGLTLIELVIVLAVIAVISAILIPNFLTTTDKARLKSDVQSARVLQNAMELYNAEQSVPLKYDDNADIIGEIYKHGYIPESQVDCQTPGAKWKFQNNRVTVDISACDSKIEDIYKQLSETEQRYVHTGKIPDSNNKS
jgi:prepilin-type N-terminal cleavage/methylation domain-containing protein